MYPLCDIHQTYQTSYLLHSTVGQMVETGPAAYSLRWNPNSCRFHAVLSLHIFIGVWRQQTSAWLMPLPFNHYLPAFSK